MALPHMFSTVGAVAQLGERVNGIHEVSGSIPLGSTNKIKTLTQSDVPQIWLAERLRNLKAPPLLILLNLIFRIHGVGFQKTDRGARQPARPQGGHKSYPESRYKGPTQTPSRLSIVSGTRGIA